MNTRPTPRRTSHRLRRSFAQEGFTVVEVLVAILILSVGVLGMARVMLVAASSTSDNKAQEGATNLAREVIENIVGYPYASMEPGNVTSALQSITALAPAPGYSDWTVLRRSIPYTLSVSGCYLDDPFDGLGPHDATFCSGSSSGTADAKPIDFKRFTATVSWTRRGKTRSITQATVVAPKSQSDVPSVSSLTSAGGLYITNSSVTSLNFTATTSSAPTGVAWLMGGSVRGLASGSGSSWSFTWDISGLPDGVYTVGAQAYDSSGTYGKATSVTVTLNRSLPTAPTGFVAGWNQSTSRVDTEWSPSTSLDTAGYTVYRQQTAPSVGAVTKVNCGTVSTPVYIVSDTDCTDASPLSPTSGAGTVGYRSAAAATSGSTTVASLTINKPAGVQTGDVMVATVAVLATSISPTSPAGWMAVRYDDTGKHVAFTMYKVAGSNEPASYSFGVANKIAMGGIAAYTGVDTNAPIDVSGSTSGGSGNAVSPNLTTRYANDRVINAVAFTSAVTGMTVTPAGSLTERWDQTGRNVVAEAADATQASAGSTGTKTATPSGANVGWISHLIALKPAANANAGISVNYWAVALDRNASGAYRESSASNKVDAYDDNLPPIPISSPLNCTTNADGSSTLRWTQPNLPGDPDSGDSIAFDRIYRDGKRFNRTDDGSDDTFTDTNPDGTHDYYVTTVDTHLAESSPTGTVTC